MPRTREQLEAAALETEAWLDSLEPATSPAEDPADLRRIGLALVHLADDERELAEAVDQARRNGRSWSMIAMALGVSKQAARKRYGERSQLDA
jgi:hypothetical protein